MVKLIFKSLKILNIDQKNKFFALSILTLIAFLLETASIGSIIPVLIFLTENQSNISTQFFDNIKFLKNLDNSQKINFFVIIFFSFFLTKNIFLIFFNWYQNKFAAQISLHLSRKLFKKYLNQSYLFFVKNNSATLIRNIVRETERFSNNVIITNANLILEILVVISISMILFIYDPKSFLFVTLIATSSYLILSVLTRRRLISWAKNRSKYEARVINKLQTSFNLYKMIKVLLKNKVFVQDYYKNMEKYNHSVRNIIFLSRIPRHTFEIVAVVSLTVLIFYLYKINNRFDEMIVLLGLFVAAAFRILPAIVRIVTSLQSIQSSMPSVKILFEELKNVNNKKPEINLEKFDFKKNIILKDVSFKYPETENNVINNLNLEIKKNQIIGIAGTSGSGKTTLIDIIMGLLRPDKGNLIIDGKKIRENEMQSWSKLIGYVPQGTYIIDDTIEKNIAFGISENTIDRTKLVNSAKNSQLHDFIMTLPRKYKTKISERGSNLSEGQKQRISIARALYFNPKILILDEATSSLDHKTEKSFINYLLKLRDKKTIIMIAHRYSVLKYCEKIYFFDLNKKFKKIDKKFVKQIS